VFTNGGRDNRITGNTITAVHGAGIDVTGSEGTVIDGNTVRNEGSANIPSGTIVVRSPSNGTEITRNVTRSELGDGILILDGAVDTVLLLNRANGNGLDGIRVLSASTTITRNTANDNGNLGIEAVTGVVDGGGNRASGNGNPAQCVGVVCT
jgi:parallel beta-helix repeat protein